MSLNIKLLSVVVCVCDIAEFSEVMYLSGGQISHAQE